MISFIRCGLLLPQNAILILQYAFQKFKATGQQQPLTLRLVRMGFAVAQIVDRWRSSELSLCLAGSVHSTSLTVVVSRLSSQVLTC